MKIIGLIGGMSWKSSKDYYSVINEYANELRGGYDTAPCVLYSLNFGTIDRLQREGNWSKLASLMIYGGNRLEDSNCEVILICANTMHKLYDDVCGGLHTPVLHVADCVADKIKEQGLATVGLLGTRFVMNESFYVDRLAQNGVTALVPEPVERTLIDSVIYDELVHGVIHEESKKAYLEIIEKLKSKGAEGIILGCTEIRMLVGPDDIDVPAFDSLEIHAKAAVDAAMK